MYVNARICMYAHICTYMHKYILWPSQCMYMHVYAIYACILQNLQVYACISSYDPQQHWDCCHLPKSQSLWTPSSGPNSGHPWDYGKSLLFVIGNIFADPISGTTPLGTPPGPLLHPPASGSSGKPSTPYQSSLIQSHGLSQEIWRTGLHPAAIE